MACKDCLHYEVCVKNPTLTEFSGENDAYCEAFKDRSKWMEQKQGRWIWKDGEIHCSHCDATRSTMKGYEIMACIGGKWVSMEKTNYCPNCGALMPEGSEGE